MKRALLSALTISTLTSSAVRGDPSPAVHPRFELASVSGAPFPSDLYTVADASNRTGRRVNLPLPDCSTRPSDCNDLAVVNTMDGFNLMPRISIPFDGDIDPRSVSSSSVFLVELAQDGDKTIVANTVGINQVVWDPETLENVRDYLKGSPPPLPANFAIGPGGSRAVFARTSIQAITFRQQMTTTSFVNAAVPLAVLNAYSAGVVSTIAWGTFVSPQFVDSNPVMTPHGTLGGVPTQLSDATLEFVLFVPTGTRPATGWPVAFLGH